MLTEVMRDFLREQKNAAVQAARDKLRQSIWPIYAPTPNDNPNHIGSGLLFNSQGSTYFLTAAHLIDEDRKEQPLLIAGVAKAGSDHLIPLGGQWLNWSISPKDDGKRDGDLLDYALRRLSADECSRLSGAHPMSEDVVDWSDTPLSPNELLVVLGYPNSKNKLNARARNTIRPQMACYTNTAINPIPDQIVARGYSAASHIILRFSDGTFNDGTHANAFYPKGVSGGGVFAVGDFEALDIMLGKKIAPPRLVGLFTTYIEGKNGVPSVIIATRLSAIRAALEQKTSPPEV